jgi:hypothetical protein
MRMKSTPYGVILDAEITNPWARYENDPVGFVEQGLGETLWSKQREILEFNSG